MANVNTERSAAKYKRFSVQSHPTAREWKSILTEATPREALKPVNWDNASEASTRSEFSLLPQIIKQKKNVEKSIKIEKALMGRKSLALQLIFGRTRNEKFLMLRLKRKRFPHEATRERRAQKT
jgi:hypothetical protein